MTRTHSAQWTPVWGLTWRCGRGHMSHLIKVQMTSPDRCCWGQRTRTLVPMATAVIRTCGVIKRSSSLTCGNRLCLSLKAPPPSGWTHSDCTLPCGGRGPRWQPGFVFWSWCHQEVSGGSWWGDGNGTGHRGDNTAAQGVAQSCTFLVWWHFDKTFSLAREHDNRHNGHWRFW